MKMARLAGLEPTASGSATLRSIQTELQARITYLSITIYGAEGGIRPLACPSSQIRICFG